MAPALVLPWPAGRGVRVGCGGWSAEWPPAGDAWASSHRRRGRPHRHRIAGQPAEARSANDSYDDQGQQQNDQETDLAVQAQPSLDWVQYSMLPRLQSNGQEPGGAFQFGGALEHALAVRMVP